MGRLPGGDAVGRLVVVCAPVLVVLVLLPVLRLRPELQKTNRVSERLAQAPTLSACAISNSVPLRFSCLPQRDGTKASVAGRTLDYLSSNQSAMCCSFLSGNKARFAHCRSRQHCAQSHSGQCCMLQKMLSRQNVLVCQESGLAGHLEFGCKASEPEPLGMQVVTCISHLH